MKRIRVVETIELEVQITIIAQLSHARGTMKLRLRPAFCKFNVNISAESWRIWINSDRGIVIAAALFIALLHYPKINYETEPLMIEVHKHFDEKFAAITRKDCILGKEYL